MLLHTVDFLRWRVNYKEITYAVSGFVDFTKFNINNTQDWVLREILNEGFKIDPLLFCERMCEYGNDRQVERIE